MRPYEVVTSKIEREGVPLEPTCRGSDGSIISERLVVPCISLKLLGHHSVKIVFQIKPPLPGRAEEAIPTCDDGFMDLE